MRLALFIALIICGPSFSDDQIWTHDCGTVKQTPAWSYCISHDIQSSNPDVVYLFHPAGTTHTYWKDGGPSVTKIISEWTQRNMEPPTVVSISFGFYWLLVSKNESPQSGLYPVFEESVLPTIEKKLGELKQGPPRKGKRILLGFAMGAFNAIQVAMRLPERFEKAALLCPAITSISPYASLEEKALFISRTKAKPLMVARAIAIAKTFLPSESTWKAQSPIHTGKLFLHSKTPSLAISIGKLDEYGFFEGTEMFAKVADKQGVDTQFWPVEGGHCEFDAEKIAAFLID